jgi:hypothetical protein
MNMIVRHDNNPVSMKKYLPEDKGQLPEDKGQLPEDKRQLPEGKRQVPEGKRQVPEGKGQVPEDKRQMFLTERRLFTAINHSVWRNPSDTVIMIGIAGSNFLVNSSNTHKKYIRQ